MKARKPEWTAEELALVTNNVGSPEKEKDGGLHRNKLKYSQGSFLSSQKLPQDTIHFLHSVNSIYFYWAVPLLYYCCCIGNIGQ